MRDESSIAGSALIAATAPAHSGRDIVVRLAAGRIRNRALTTSAVFRPRSRSATRKRTPTAVTVARDDRRFPRLAMSAIFMVREWPSTQDDCLTSMIDKSDIRYW